MIKQLLRGVLKRSGTLSVSLTSSFVVAFISGIVGLVMLLHDVMSASHLATGR